MFYFQALYLIERMLTDAMESLGEVWKHRLNVMFQMQEAPEWEAFCWVHTVDLYLWIQKAIDNSKKSDRHLSTKTRMGKPFVHCTRWMNMDRNTLETLTYSYISKKKEKFHGKQHYINFSTKVYKKQTMSQFFDKSVIDLFTRGSFVGTCRHSSFYQ